MCKEYCTFCCSKLLTLDPCFPHIFPAMDRLVNVPNHMYSPRQSVNSELRTTTHPWATNMVRFSRESMAGIERRKAMRVRNAFAVDTVGYLV